MTSDIQPEEELRRADIYSLLATLLHIAPSAELLDKLRELTIVEKANASGLQTAWLSLKQVAQQTILTEVVDEFHQLFIGLGQGEVLPYASHYLTGLLMDKPLALLREDLNELGFSRQAHIHEPEDHAGCLCEVMSLLIYDGYELAVQRQFFNKHLARWITNFFGDLERANSARFYQSVGQLGRQFIQLEQQAFAMLR